ncbi:hypothetical protein [Saccharothrix syringae]|uniref:Uncharacterized protein n=1 Tax=Saccharothrix syringae TaxID=103733 RepID=A0A5Q0H380_SACSY|nr:hypothetical protein [Saccharothrix syringae]QFZ20661.1 hypothetical protein EKG83_27570 [Saccharothrix syringae]
MVEVELDVFSGKPNPTWSLSPADADAFAAKVAALPAASPTALANPLGYRGFLVHVRGEERKSEVAVQEGSVQSTAGGTTTYLGDPGRALERWLLDTGRPSLPPELVEAVERSLR